MSEVVLSELAEADLTDIWAFVSQADAEAADRLIDQIHEKSLRVFQCTILWLV